MRECRGVVCSYLHQVFIADTNLAKLVHFQGYPMELLPVTVRGIPSMHICLDFLPELLSQPAPDKQVFAVNLASYLALQYALVKSLGVARLAFFSATLPALARICEAFPALLDDVVSFLMQLGRVGVSQGSLDGHSCSRGIV
ncbi:hypothetical protein B566_EDAN016420 [Ephemera danica]|nr:hypothetical protein B566_EDAN016420 [Ephemera danica]